MKQIQNEARIKKKKGIRFISPTKSNLSNTFHQNVFKQYLGCFSFRNSLPQLFFTPKGISMITANYAYTERREICKKNRSVYLIYKILTELLLFDIVF